MTTTLKQKLLKGLGMKIRLNPTISATKLNENGGTSGEWKNVEAEVWYIHDSDEDKYTDFETFEVEEHDVQPGLCIAFTVGKREVAITIGKNDLIRALADVTDGEERFAWENGLTS
jgi:hypothetical protein